MNRKRHSHFSRTTAFLTLILLTLSFGMTVDRFWQMQLLSNSRDRGNLLDDHLNLTYSFLPRLASSDSLEQTLLDARRKRILVSDFLSYKKIQKENESDVLLERYSASILDLLDCESGDDFRQQVKLLYPYANSVTIESKEFSELREFIHTYIATEGLH